MKEMVGKFLGKIKAVPKKIMLLALIAFGLGILMAFVLRFSLVNENKTHYHANFALYVNGVKDEFKSFTFYEEIAACSANASDDPKVRTHMHDNINSVIHVHDNAVTWSDFFNNLGYTLGNKVLATPAGVYVDGADGKKLQFYLNGALVTTISDEVIKSEDVLLIDYGNDTNDTLKQYYNAIPKTAHEYNVKNDPSSCTGSAKETLSHRFKRTLGIGDSH